VVVTYSALKTPVLEEIEKTRPIIYELLYAYTFIFILWSVGFGYKVKRIIEESKLRLNKVG